VPNTSTLIHHVRTIMSTSPADKPIYQRLANALLEALAVTEAAGGEVLPSERRLAAELGISRVTVRQGLELIAREGRVRRQQGSHTRVADRVQKALSAVTGFSEELIARGSVPGHRWISRQTVLPTPTEAMSLGLSTNDRVVRLVRVRTADGRPLAIERATVPQAILPSGDLVEDSLYDTLRALGFGPAQGTQRIRAGVMTAVEAEFLEVEVGAPLLIIERRCCLSDGRAVEFTETRYNGALYEFLTDIHR
jgi:GntR family transcriptional regulator